MKISVIIPAYNSEINIVENVYKIITALKKLKYKAEIIIVDDASSDDTYLLAAKDISTQVTLLRKVQNQGKGSAIKTGWKFATGDYILTIDADLQISVEEVKTFFKIMHLYDADVVIGNKKHVYSNTQYPFYRKIVSLVYSTMVKLLFNLSIRDTQCGFKLYKRESLDLIMSKIYIKRFAFDLEVLVAMKVNNIRVADAPVYVSRPLGKGSVSIKTIFETFKDTLAIWWRKMKGEYVCVKK